MNYIVAIYWRQILNQSQNVRTYQSIYTTQKEWEDFFPQLQNTQKYLGYQDWYTTDLNSCLISLNVPLFLHIPNVSCAPTSWLSPCKLFVIQILFSDSFLSKRHYYVFHSNQHVNYTLIIEGIFEIFLTRTQLQKPLMNTTIC